METIVPGYKYSLFNVQNPSIKQELQFVHTQHNDLYKEHVVIKDGVTDKEVLSVLADRYEYLEKENPDNKEVKAVLKRLRNCISDVEDLEKQKQQTKLE